MSAAALQMHPGQLTKGHVKYLLGATALPHGQNSLLRALVDLADKEWTFDPHARDLDKGVGHLATATGYSMRHTRRLLRQVERLGVVVTTPDTLPVYKPRVQTVLVAQLQRLARGLADLVGAAAAKVVATAKKKAAPVLPAARPAEKTRRATVAVREGRDEAAQVVQEVLGERWGAVLEYTTRDAGKLWYQSGRPDLEKWRADWQDVLGALESRNHPLLEDLATPKARPIWHPKSWRKRVALARGSPRSPGAGKAAYVAPAYRSPGKADERTRSRWPDVLAQLRLEVGDELVDAMASDVRPGPIRDGALVLETKSTAFADWLVSYSQSSIIGRALAAPFVVQAG